MWFKKPKKPMPDNAATISQYYLPVPENVWEHFNTKSKWLSFLAEPVPIIRRRSKALKRDILYADYRNHKKAFIKHWILLRLIMLKEWAKLIKEHFTNNYTYETIHTLPDGTREYERHGFWAHLKAIKPEVGELRCIYTIGYTKSRAEFDKETRYFNLLRKIRNDKHLASEMGAVEFYEKWL